MRVLHLIDSLVAHGAERSLVALAPHLLKRGLHYEVAHLMEATDLAPALADIGVRVHDLRGPDNRGDQINRVTALLRGRRPDLLHTTLYRSDVAGRPAARANGIPSVCTWASTPPLHGNLLVHAKRRRTTAIDRWTARHVTRFHAVSEPVANSVGALLGVDSSRIEVIPRGRDPLQLGQRSPRRRRQFREKLGIGEGPMIVALARHEPGKGIDVLADAVALLHEAHPDLVVIVGGDFGTQTESLRHQIDALGLSPVLRLAGPLQHVGDLLAAADVFTAPSRVEGFPGSVVEAMFVGTPVVASDLPTVRAALPDAAHGWLPRPDDPFDLAQALDDALLHRSDALDRGRRARAHALANYSLPGIADRTISFYERALSRTDVTVR